tara:strand:+ start:205 stop:471 length:267 start_codon:yes stop_codon:yes gene_type:complete
MKTQFIKHNQTDLLKELTSLSAHINYYMLECEQKHAQEHYNMLLEDELIPENTTFENWLKTADIDEHIYIPLFRSEEVINEIINRKLY